MARPKNCGRCKKPKTRCKCGRPPVMTKETISKLEEGFGFGYTDAQACLHAGISVTPFYEYIKQNPEFAERKEALKTNTQMIAKRNLHKRLIEEEGKKKIGLTKWVLERSDAAFAGAPQLPQPGTTNITNNIIAIQLKDEYEEKLRQAYMRPATPSPQPDAATGRLNPRVDN